MSDELKALQLVKAIRPEILPHIAEMARKGVHPFPPLEPATPPKPSRHPSEAYPVNMDAIRRANEGPTPEPFRPVAGRDCITRDGQRAREITKIKSAQFHFEGRIDGNYLTWTKRGYQWHDEDPDPLDLVGFWEDGE